MTDMTDFARISDNCDAGHGDRSRSRKLLGNLLLLLTAVIWGTAFVFQRTGMEDIGPFVFNASRMFLAAAATAPLALLSARADTRTPGPAAGAGSRRKATAAGGICCGLFLGAASLFQQAGLVYTTAGKAGFITAMYMLLVPVLNFLLFRKRNTWLVWLAVAVGVTGMYLLCIQKGTVFGTGDLLVSVCAFLFSGHILCCDHFVQEGDPLGIASLQFLTAGLVSAAAALAVREPLTGLAAAAVPILYCGLVSGGVGYTLQVVAQKLTDPTTASLLMSLESVFAAIAGALLLKERMSVRELAGCIVMFIAIILVQVPLPVRSGGKDRR